jgi:hypothetical protein
MAIVVMAMDHKAISQETIVFDQTVTWEWPLPKWYGGNSFYWWHRSMEGVGVTNFGDMSSTDWQSPANYRNGTFYMRFEVISQPTSNPFRIQLGIWQDISKTGGHSETISGNVDLSGGTGSVTETSIGSPASWWQIRTDAPVDFTRPEDFYRIGIVLWKGTCVVKGQGWGTDGCPEYQAEFFPMQARITVVACAQGTAFSGWETYTGGTTRPPTPNYAVDFINKLTDKVIASTDEYSSSSTMSEAVSGTGQKLALTPGQDIYFRTKADGETPASLVQHLAVPAKPAAPTFTYNAASLRTTQTVSNAYEYADNVSMTGAISGSGDYVSFALGTTKYFRKKATSSAFESNVQALLGSASEPPSSIGPEFVILNEIIDFPNATDDNGFYFFYYNSSMPTNWLSTYNYYDGQVYTRYEILSQASSEPVGLQFGIWQKLPPETGTLYENMETVRVLNGPGSVVTNNSSPNTWWKYNGGCDFTQMDKVWHFGINPYRVVPSNVQIRSENADVWNVRNTYWFPMRVRVTVVAVASGYTFSGWENYIGDGTSPSYEIDFVSEQTTTPIASTDEYSINQITWTSGTDTKLSLTPGQDVYFRSKAFPMYTQHLIVPAKPALPAFAIDFVNERTSAIVSSEYEYSDNSNMSAATTGSGQYLMLTPSSTKYFRKRATDDVFSSSIQTLNIAARPVAPEININFIDEETVEVINSTVEYANTSDFVSAVSGSGSTIILIPGTTVFFREKANAGQFQSLVKTLTVPAYPAAPTFGINFPYERTLTVVSSDYEYSMNSNMTAAQIGSNVIVKLTPGVDLYFRKKASTTAFSSGVQHLVVPERPAAPTITIDYAQEKTAELIMNTIHYSETADFSITHEAIGNSIKVTPGVNLYFRSKPSNNEFTSQTFTLLVPNRPVITSQMTNPTSQSPIVVNVTFPGAVNGFENADFLVTNGTVSAVTDNYVANIIPSASGLVSVTLKANTVSPANFASAIFSITYSGATSINDVETETIKLYPTVSPSQIILECKNCSNENYYVFDGNGRKVLSGNLTNINTIIDIVQLLPAAYQLILVKPERNITFRFIKAGN